MGLYDKVTVDGQRLTRKTNDGIRAAARAAGAGVDGVTVVKGSWKAPDGLSGSTHTGSGVADLRVWNLPADVRRSMCEPLIVELRKRGFAAWYRDQAHGGFDPHIHLVDIADPGLSLGARSQAKEWLAGGDGLSGSRLDYHPRPKVWPSVAWTNLKSRPADVLLVQKALASYVGLNYSSGPGKWGPRTSAAWARAAVKSRRTGVDLLSFLGFFHGSFRPAP